MHFKQSFIGSSIAFLLATSCCWLPWLILAVGGATGVAGWTKGLEAVSGPVMAARVGLLALGGYQFYKKKKTPARRECGGRSQTISLWPISEPSGFPFYHRLGKAD